MITPETPPSLRGPLHRLRPGLFLIAAAVATVRLPAAVLSGVVLEDATDAKLAGVVVTVVSASGNRLPPVITDANGLFTVTGVPVGEVMIEYSTGNYLLNPTRKPCQVREPEERAADVRLFKKSPSPDYLLQVADRLLQLAATDPEAANRQWQAYDALPISFSAKATLAQAVLRKNQEIKSLAQKKADYSVDLREVASLEAKFQRYFSQPGTKIQLTERLPEQTIREVFDAQVQMRPAIDRPNWDRALAFERPR